MKKYSPERVPKLAKATLSHVDALWIQFTIQRNLKELRNCISRITRVWSLFVPYGFMQVYIFCRFFWETSVLYFCTFCIVWNAT